MARLEIRKLSGVRTHDLNGEPLVIGRSSSNPVQLRHSNVSRQHCVIEQADGRIVLRDLESHVGTTVNGERITEAELKTGDRIMVGPYELIVVDEDAAAAPLDLSEPINDAEPSEDALAALRDEVAQSSAELGSARQEIAALTQSAESSRAEDRVSKERAAHAQKELAGLRQELETVLAQWQAEQEAHDRSRADIRLQQEMNASFQAQMSRLNDELETLRSERQATTEHAERTIESLQGSMQQSRLEIEQLEHTRADLLARLREHDRSQHQSQTQGEKSQKAWHSLREQMTTLDGLAAQLNAVQTRLAKAESQWLEADQVLAASPPHAPQAAVARQRQTQLSSQLESLHQQRDDTVGQLCSRMQKLLAEAGELPNDAFQRGSPSDRGAAVEPMGFLSKLRGRKSQPSA